MPPYDDLLHDFPDRAIRRLLEAPQNLRDLLADLAPDLASRFDFAQREILPRSFLLDDWRRREADMFFRLPFQDAPDAPPALVCILVEHQSEAEPAMPLRTLLYAVLHWQEEWKAWEAGHPPGESLRLQPIVPVIFHTGLAPWRTHRTMADLIGATEALRPFAPEWQPLFWDLAERSVEELAQAAEELLVALAVVRGERADEAAYQELVGTVLRRLEALSESERVRWHELLWFVLSWALRRRPGREREALMQTAKESQTQVADREEVARIGEAVAETWEQELVARGMALGEARGEARGELRARREDLRALLAERFGPLTVELAERIEATDDLERLRGAMRQVLHVSSPEELDL
jgi:hypothetical protein